MLGVQGLPFLGSVQEMMSGVRIPVSSHVDTFFEKELSLELCRSATS